MPVKIIFDCSEIDIPMDEPIFYPESPLIGDLICVINLFKYHSDERMNLMTKLEEKDFDIYGTVMKRTWKIEKPGSDPHLRVTIKMLKK